MEQIQRRLDKLLVEVTQLAQTPDEQAIHDSRVAIRRFSQGLILFPKLFPESAKKTRKRLKAIMKASNEVRNRDIAMEYLQESGEPALIERLRKERSEYAEECRQLAAEWPHPKPPKTRKFKVTAAEHAICSLPSAAREYFEAGREATRKQRPPRELHRFRVHTKRYRYALEMFKPLYGPEFEKQLDKLHHLQRILGKISDAYTIRELLKHEGSYKQDLAEEGKRRIEEFRRYWTQEFDAPDQLDIWITVLGTIP